MLTEPLTSEELMTAYWQQYEGEPLIRLSEEIPEIREVAGTPGLAIGGFTVDERDSMRASFVVVLDNLLKGAASQALQNINLALGLDELTGVAEAAQ
jgi:N-acetyl-gamma-glutamyl-phosphate reductase